MNDFRKELKLMARKSMFEENDFDVNFNLMNSETAGDGIDDLEAWG